MHVEPELGALDVRIEATDQPPEARRVVELDQVRDLVRGEIVEHEGRRQDETPGERQHAGVRARSPAARLVAHRDTLERDVELARMAPARALEIALRLALEEVADAAVDVRALARDAQQEPTFSVSLGPHRSALAAAMHDAVGHTAQRHLGPMREWRRFRQPLEPRRDPAAVLLGEFLRFLQAAARRHGENHFARGCVDAQGVAPRLSVPSQSYEIDGLVENDLDGRWLTRTPIQQRTQRH